MRGVLGLALLFNLTLGVGATFADTFSVERLISSNEALLKRFRSQYEAMALGPAMPSEEFQKKQKSLENKIRVLENDTARLKMMIPYEEKKVHIPLAPNVPEEKWILTARESLTWHKKKGS